MKKKINFLLIYWLPVLTLAAIIFKLSSGAVPKASDVYWQDFAAKKLAHVLVYGLLAVLIFRALNAGGMSKKKAIIFSVILATVYGMTDEIHQSFSQVREARVRDIGFDGLGASLFMYFVVKILPKMPKDFVGIGKKLEII